MALSQQWKIGFLQVVRRGEAVGEIRKWYGICNTESIHSDSTMRAL